MSQELRLHHKLLLVQAVKTYSVIVYWAMQNKDTEDNCNILAKMSQNILDIVDIVLKSKVILGCCLHHSQSQEL